MSDRQLLWIKKEVTYGLDPVAAAVDTVMAEGVTFTPSAERKKPSFAKPGVGPAPTASTVGVYGTLVFKTPLAAPLTKGVAALWGKLAKACGWTETLVPTTSATYALAADPSAADSVTITYREGRRLHKLTGSRGRMGVEIAENDRPMLTFTFKGLKTVVADGAIIAHADATWTGWKDTKAAAQGRTTFTVGAATPPLYSLSIEQSDNVNFADRPNQKVVDLVGLREFTGKLKCGMLLPSVLNWEALAEADTVSTMSVVHGTVSGEIVTISLRAGNEEPSYGDDNGRDTADVSLSLMPSAMNTDDDIAIVCT